MRQVGLVIDLGMLPAGEHRSVRTTDVTSSTMYPVVTATPCIFTPVLFTPGDSARSRLGP
jgi:hypothetical protein